MNRTAIIDYLLEKFKYSSEQRELIKSIESAREELQLARQFFDAVSDPQLVDYAIHKEDAAKARYCYLLKEARNSGVQLEASLMLDELEAI